MDDSTFSDMSRSARAVIWFGFYVLCWLAMGLSCRVDLPPNCRRASEPMEVLTELPVLLVFALSQASVLRCRPELARCVEPIAVRKIKADTPTTEYILLIGVRILVKLDSAAQFHPVLVLFISCARRRKINNYLYRQYEIIKFTVCNNSFPSKRSWCPYILTLLEAQSRFGDKLLKFQVDCPQNGIAVLNGLRGYTRSCVIMYLVCNHETRRQHENPPKSLLRLCRATRCRFPCGVYRYVSGAEDARRRWCACSYS